jgi:ATP-binding cassette, subfamily B, bacterial
VSVLHAGFELFTFAWREDRRRFAWALGLMMLQSAAAPLSALALGAVVDAAVARQGGPAISAAILAASCVIASLTAGHFAHIYYFELGDMMLLRLQSRLIDLSNGSDGVDHHERPDYADKLQVVREELNRAGSSLISSLLGALGLAVAIALTSVTLVSLNPWLLCLPGAALPPLLLGKRAEAVLAASREAAAQPSRRARHLLKLATEASSCKELRTCNLEAEIRARHASEWVDASALLWRGEWRSLCWRIAGQLVFAVAYIGATLLVVFDAVSGRGSPGDVILAIVLAAQVNQQVTAAVTLHQELQRLSKTLDDMRWIEALVRRPSAASGQERPPAALTRGIAFENVSFGYPSIGRKVLEGVNAVLAPGSTVAIVGENGAGKTTLVKLLSGFYEVGDGAIRVDGVDLRSIALPAWRRCIAAGFQDFVKFEFLARETVGCGHLEAIESADAVRGALRRARSEDVIERLDDGLETALGQSNPNGKELSLGQWQKLALGRAMMRERPLLLILDEPTSALDAQSEHLLFEQYAANAKRVGQLTGAITLLVSHRFSTVRMADQILVVAGGKISEMGSHVELMKQGGIYADLYALQARAYQ